MSILFRQFEILLPLQFNGGEPVPPELIAAVELELEERFGAISAQTQTIRGRWQQEGKTYQDNLGYIVSTRCNLTTFQANSRRQ